MTSLNTFLDVGWARCRSQLAIAALAGLCLPTSAQALDPSRVLSQYVRDSWGTEKGFPGGSISAIVQTPDGYLWIGTDKGLVRFDGLNFRKFEQATPNAFPVGPVANLLADGQGNLWVLLRNTKLLRYHDGIFELSRGEAENGITAICRSTAGGVLVSSLAKGTLMYDGVQFQRIQSGPVYADPVARANGVPPDERSSSLSWSTGVTSHRLAGSTSAVVSIVATADSKIWLGTEDRGVFVLSEGKTSELSKWATSRRVTSFLPLEGNDLWIGTSQGVLHWNGANLTRSGVPSALLDVAVLSMIRDRDSNIWVATSGGLIRVNSQGISGAGHRAEGAVTAVFEDREGNLWLGGTSGIQRLRDSAFVTYSVADGLPSESNGPIYVDTKGRTWFAPLEGGLHWIQAGQHRSVTADGLVSDVVYSISGNEDELWVGRQRGGLTLLRSSGGSFAAKTYTHRDGLAENSVYAVHKSHDGTVWAGTLGGGVSAFRKGRFFTYTTANGLSSNTVTSITESLNGTVWIATSNGLSAFSNGRWRIFTVKDGLPTADLNCLLVDSAGVLWIGSAAGVAFLSSDHVQVPTDVPELLHEPIFGIAEDRNGWLWIASSNHVLRVKRSELLGSASSDANVRAYGLTDGLLGTEGVKRHQSVVADSVGRIWFSMNHGLSVVSPNRAVDNSAPTLVHVESVSMNGNVLDPRLPIRISAASQRITFDYVGLSLSSPERVRFRYRLDGFDHDWSEPTVIRTAIYTNLGPGSYRFRVTASNSDGLWNGAEAAVGFAVTPTLWQTWWFRLGLAICAGLAAIGVYRLRMHQLTRVLNARFEERLSERTRIARELHDTLLQSLHGVMFQFQAVRNMLARSPEKAVKTLDDAISSTRDVIAESRDAIHDLRSRPVAEEDLAQVLEAVGEELADAQGETEESPIFRVIQEGERQKLSPELQDEVHRIAREVMRNSFRHAGADHIEAEIRYDKDQFCLRLRDDGKGIHPTVLQASRRPGHWGLPGVSERAERIGARLRIWSEAGAGTEVELMLPAALAYERMHENSRFELFRKRHKKL